jgi:hypothetical protein
MPAEPKLLEYAYRVKQDVPFEADVVKFEKIKAIDSEGIENKELSSVTFDKKNPVRPLVEVGFGGLDNFSDVIEQPDLFNVIESVKEHFLTNSYERVVNVYGRFQQESIALGLSELR